MSDFKNYKFDTSNYIVLNDGLIRIQKKVLDDLKTENEMLREALNALNFKKEKQ